MRTLAFLLLVAAAAAGCAAAGPTVSTEFGQIEGVLSNGIYSFKGIPYAQAPVGLLRFADPVLVSNWSPNVFKATEYGAGCMQNCSVYAFPKTDIMCTPKISEDCLFLNIFTPTLNASANLPVIFFIHGGNYIGGSGGVPLYDGTDLAINQNAVVVTINYRLGVFGALYTGTVQGNFQIKDQRMAMTWVSIAIGAFGGNPSLVTITGQSAGAFSVATHLASPPSWGLFQRAIIVSDPFSLLAANPEIGQQLGDTLLKDLGCPSGGDAELNCLRAANASDILHHQLTDLHLKPSGSSALMLAMSWVPVIDPIELPHQPLNALRNGFVAPNVPVMFGTVANESVQFIYDILKKKSDNLAVDLLIDFVFDFNETILSAAWEQYGPLPANDNGDGRMAICPLATDYIFYCSNRAVGRGLTSVTPTYMYLFDYVSPNYKWVYEKYMPYCDNVACHAVDLAFIFNPWKYMTESHPAFMANETHLAHFIQHAWGNFARSGDPNLPNALPDGIVYPRFDGTTNTIVNYSIPVNVISGYRDAECDMWDSMGYDRF